MYNKLEMFDFDEMEKSVFSQLVEDFHNNPSEIPVLRRDPELDFNKE
jgi:hypothetical protein